MINMFVLTNELLAEIKSYIVKEEIDLSVEAEPDCYTCQDACHRECPGNCGGPQKSGQPYGQGQ